MTGYVCGGLLALATMCAQGADLLSAADQAFFHDQARRVVASARLAPGAESGGFRNTTRFMMYFPGGVPGGYRAFWVRDSVMMLGSDLVPAADVESWIRLMASVIRDNDWKVREDVVVPAFALPDHINFDGQASYYPGGYETGEKQGGPLFGKYPPLDDHFYFISAVYHHWKLTKSTVLFRSPVKTHFGAMKLAELCERVYRVAPVDDETGLCSLANTTSEGAKDFGFCDLVSKSGRLLFPSVLKFVAAQQMAELFRAAGEQEKAQRYTNDAARIRRNIAPVFFHSSKHEGEGWLHSATGVGNQPDVWGSAFAIYSGAVEGATARKVARALVRAYREKTAVRDGCVRHILTTDTKNHGGWEQTAAKPGEYQNGGYWGTASGWYIAAIHTVDREAAAAMARDYIRFLRANMRKDGMSETWEWQNPDTGKNANPLYVATAGLPWAALEQAGLVK